MFKIGTYIFIQNCGNNVYEIEKVNEDLIQTSDQRHK